MIFLGGINIDVVSTDDKFSREDFKVAGNRKLIFREKKGKIKSQKDKFKCITEETILMQDSLQINNGGVHSERLLDVGRSFKSIRILERRYNQPKQSINETDTEMAIVLITFPCH